MRTFQALFILLVTIFLADPVMAQTEQATRRAPNASVLTVERWKQLDASVERGLKWMATEQQDDGSFEAIDLAQPAVTSFCVLAFLAQGESPVDGKYKQQLTKAIDYIADQQKPNGLIARNAPASVPISRDIEESESAETIDSQTQPKPNAIATTAVYNHAISALGLCEAYGQCSPAQTEKLAPVIEKAIAATLEMQRWDGKKKKKWVAGAI